MNLYSSYFKSFHRPRKEMKVSRKVDLPLSDELNKVTLWGIEAGNCKSGCCVVWCDLGGLVARFLKMDGVSSSLFVFYVSV